MKQLEAEKQALELRVGVLADEIVAVKAEHRNACADLLHRTTELRSIREVSAAPSIILSLNALKKYQEADLQFQKQQEKIASLSSARDEQQRQLQQRQIELVSLQDDHMRQLSALRAQLGRSSKCLTTSCCTRMEDERRRAALELEAKNVVCGPFSISTCLNCPGHCGSQAV
jgi:hypothetical protein